MTAASRHVLVVEDKPTVRAMFVRALASVDCTVLTATSLAEAVAAARRTPPHVIVLDLRLPDATELESLEAILARRIRTHVIVVSGFLTTELTVQAMKLGAIHVFEKPVRIDPFLNVVRTALGTALSAAPHPAGQRGPARGAASRFVDLVLRTLDADRDLKTLGAWAGHVAVSVTMLRQACSLAHLRPHDARDFVRVLVAVIRARKMGCDLELLLDIADTRTLHPLIQRAGLTGRTIDATVEDLLARQRFIPAGHEVLRQLRDALKR